MRHWRYSTVVAEFWLYGRKAVRGLKSLEARDFSRVRLHGSVFGGAGSAQLLRGSQGSAAKKLMPLHAAGQTLTGLSREEDAADKSFLQQNYI